VFALWGWYMRSSVMDNLVQDYVRTARAKGASERRVLWGHIFRNSLMSIVTLLGFTLIVTLITIIGNLLADIGYAMLDPRNQAQLTATICGRPER
jgi:ABC-type dipeptide/oligopeptide/nickel transport system permease component